MGIQPNLKSSQLGIAFCKVFEDIYLQASDPVFHHKTHAVSTKAEGMLCLRLLVSFLFQSVLVHEQICIKKPNVPHTSYALPARLSPVLLFHRQKYRYDTHNHWAAVIPRETEDAGYGASRNHRSLAKFSGLQLLPFRKVYQKYCSNSLMIRRNSENSMDLLEKKV